MATLIEAVFENGVLKPLDVSELKEHHHYQVLVEEFPWEDYTDDPEFEAELDRRTTILPDGRKVIWLGGIFGGALDNVPEDEDPIADLLGELRRERQAHLEAELDGFLPKNTEE